VSDNHIESQLFDFFSLIGSEKRKQKEEMDSLVGDSFDKLFIEQLKPKKPQHPEAPKEGEEVMYVDLNKERLENLYKE